MSTARVTPWAGGGSPNQAALWQTLVNECGNASLWSNGPHDMYAEHSHSYDKVIYVVRGSITFGLPELGEQFTLKAGDRLDLPAGIVHNAVVGSQGVACLEAHKV